MNLSVFLDRYRVTSDAGNTAIPRRLRSLVDADFVSCLENLGGKTFENGLYRVHRANELRLYTRLVSRVFSAVKGRIVVFAADWSGRQFAVNSLEQVGGKPCVECFDLGGPDSFCTDQDVFTFHNCALVEQPQAALAAKFFKKWHEKSAESIGPDECVGYKVPLFLNGKDVLANLQKTDMKVYLELCAQLWNQVKDLPEGTPIDKIVLLPGEQE